MKSVLCRRLPKPGDLLERRPKGILWWESGICLAVDGGIVTISVTGLHNYPEPAGLRYPVQTKTDWARSNWKKIREVPDGR